MIKKIIILCSLFFTQIFSLQAVGVKDESKSIITDIEFKGHPFRMEIILPPENDVGCLVYFYDDKDTVLGGPFPAPFLQISWNGEDADWYIALVAKTDALSGKDVVELAKCLQQLLAISHMELIDEAVSLQCPKNGTWCIDEASTPLRIAGVFSKGVGFYEFLGARLTDRFLPKDYRKSADFLHHGLAVKALMGDLIILKEDHPKAQELYRCLLESFDHAGLEFTHEVTFSDLANGLIKKKDTNPESHQGWHAFVNQVVNNKDGFFFELIGKMVSNPSQYDDRLLEVVCLTLVRDGVLYDIDNPSESQAKIEEVSNNAASEGVSKKISKSTSGIQRNRFFRMTEVGRHKTKEFCQIFEDYRKNNIKISRNHIEAILNKKIEDVRITPEFRNLITSLIDDLEKHQNEKQYPPGHVYAVWMLAKLMVRDSYGFTFDFAPLKD